MIKYDEIMNLKIGICISIMQKRNPKVSVLKSQFDTLECTLEELAILELIYRNPLVKQKELVMETGKSISTIKRIMDSLQKKELIHRVDGKRYGKC